jgi:glycosyltransferase involved in cell wall biosynthesis
MLKTSIALATYNGAKYLGEQLQSFITQTHQPDELIICDDGSEDETVALAQRFSEEAPFAVKLFLNDKNLGYAQNFSKALDLCNGDIVFLSDQDDVWHPKKIETILSRFAAEPSLQLLIHDLEFCKEDLTPIGQTKIERMEGIFNLDCDYVVGMASAIRGPFLKLCLPVPSKVDLTHDSWLHFCAMAVDKKAIIRDVLAMYRRHSSNATVAVNLNVDYVTTPIHFKGAKASLARLNIKTEMESMWGVIHLEWLRKNKTILVAGGYTTLNQIDHIIDKVEIKIAAKNLRSSILKHSGPKRIFLIIKLYGSGGYAHFSGWKSAVKDLFF